MDTLCQWEPTGVTTKQSCITFGHLGYQDVILVDQKCPVSYETQSTTSSHALTISKLEALPIVSGQSPSIEYMELVTRWAERLWTWVSFFANIQTPSRICGEIVKLRERLRERWDFALHFRTDSTWFVWVHTQHIATRRERPGRGDDCAARDTVTPTSRGPPMWLWSRSRKN